MAIGAIAGALSGAGEQLNRNRQYELDRGDYNIRREAADRASDVYERETAFREIMASRPDPNQIAQQIAQQGQGQALPADGMGPPEAAAPPPKYRDAYTQWKQNADQLAMRAGGLEGYQKFQEMENATSRRMVMGYGLEAIRAMDEGDLGTAVKAANTALETTPFNTGMKFVPRNGELYMEGAGGELSGPLNADALKVFVEDNMKTPEAYLNWKKQYEEERAAKAEEKLTGRRIGVAERQASTAEGYLDIAKKKLPADLSKTGAEIYSLLKNADAAYMRAMDSGEDSGLSAADIRDINEAIPTLIQNAKIDPGSQWWGAMTQNPGVANMMQSGAIDTAKLNLMTGGNYADAIGLAAFAFAPFANVNQPEGVRIGGIGFKGEGENRRPFAVWNDKEIWIPPSVYTALEGQINAKGDGAESGVVEPALDPFRE